MLNLYRNKFQRCKLQQYVVQIRTEFSTFCNNSFQLATLKFVARQVEHAVVILATTRSTCNATRLQDMFNKNVARITVLPRKHRLFLNKNYFAHYYHLIIVFAPLRSCFDLKVILHIAKIDRLLDRSYSLLR